METTAPHISVLTTHLQGKQQSNVVIDPRTGSSLEYRHLIKVAVKSIWINCFADKIGRIAQVVGTRTPSVTKKIFFILKGIFPAGRKVAYGIIVA